MSDLRAEREERERCSFGPEPRLDPPDEDRLSPPWSREAAAAVAVEKAERIAAKRWCPAMPPALSPEWQRIERARMRCEAMDPEFSVFGRQKR